MPATFGQTTGESGAHPVAAGIGAAIGGAATGAGAVAGPVASDVSAIADAAVSPGASADPSVLLSDRAIAALARLLLAHVDRSVSADTPNGEVKGDTALPDAQPPS